jgi:hypothetical protein
MRESFPATSPKAPELRRLRDSPERKIAIQRGNYKKSVHFSPRVNIRPISSRLIQSEKMRSLLWWDRDELRRMIRDQCGVTKNLPLDDHVYEEGGFFLHLYGMDTQEGRLEKYRRVVDSIKAVLNVQARQNRQNKWKKSTERDMTPMFMIAIQYSWHTLKALETAKTRAIQQTQELETLWRTDELMIAEENNLMSLGEVAELLHTAAGHDTSRPVQDKERYLSPDEIVLEDAKLLLNKTARSQATEHDNPAVLRAKCKAAVRKVVSLNRFLEQIHGKCKSAMDRVHNVDMKSFKGTKRRNFLKDIRIPDHLLDMYEYDSDEEKKDTGKCQKRLESILLIPEMKSTRPKRNIQWAGKLHRVKYVPIFPNEFQKIAFFYTSEEINKFRFEKFMEDHGDDFEEILEDEADGDDDEYEYEEVSYHSISDEEEYYEEETVEVIPNFQHLSQPLSAGGIKRSSV